MKKPSLGKGIEKMIVVRSRVYEQLLSLRVELPDGTIHTPRKFLEKNGFKEGDQVVLTLAPKPRSKTTKKLRKKD